MTARGHEIAGHADVESWVPPRGDAGHSGPAVVMPASVLVAEDRPTRAGIRNVLSGRGFTICADATDADTAVRAALRSRPHLCLVGAQIPGGGLRATLEIAAMLPRTAIVVLTGLASEQELLAAVYAGARGYLAKDASPERLPHVLKQVLRGEPALPRRLMGSLVDVLRGTGGWLPTESPATSRLTARERQVLELLGDNCSTGEIAQRLGISNVTVRRHISQLVTKLEVADRASAAALARHPGPYGSGATT